MRAYVIEGMVLTTYGGKRLPLEVLDRSIRKEPVWKLKEAVLDAFSSMKDPPVRVSLKLRYV